MEMRVENWCGYEIRFVEVDGEWWAILKDICDALRLRTDKIANRLDPDMLMRVSVETTTDIPSRYNRSDNPSRGLRSKIKIYDDASNDIVKDDHPSRGVNFNTFNKTVHMLAVNESGIYEALFASRRLEARKFRKWTTGVLSKLRRHVGLEGYEVMRMTEPEIQDEIDYILDGLFYDPETKQLMYSVTVAGGDVDQVPFDEYMERRRNE